MTSTVHARSFRAHRWVALLVVCAHAVATLAAAPPPLDRWYTLEMQGSPAGWMHSQRAIEGDRVTTRSEMKLRVRRGAMELSFGMSTEFVETADGEPVEMSATTELGGTPSTQRYVWTEDGVRHSVSGAGPERTALLPEPEGKWLPPGAAAAFVAARLRAGAEEIVVRTLDPLSGLRIATTQRTGIAPEKVDVGGRTVDVFRMESVADIQPGVTTIEHLDENGDAVRMETQLGGFEVVISTSDRASVTGEPAGEAPELMASLFIKPSRPIAGAHSTRAARFVVRSTDGELPDIPSVGYQKAERIDDGSVRVTVDLATLGDALGEGESREGYLKSTVYLDTKDPAVRTLAQRGTATIEGRSAKRAAEALRTLVHRHIRAKDLSVGFATASEVARSGEGDCTEHAVLLAALLRVQRIPSRVVGGLIYADRFAGGQNIFGYHAWTQALLPASDGTERWVDLDATLPGGRVYSGAHIALSVSSLEDAGPVGGLADLAPLLGRLEIDVEMTR